MTNKPKPHPGWQTVAQAVKQTGYTRQRIHQLLAERCIVCHEVYRRLLVPDPFPVAKARSRAKKLK